MIADNCLISDTSATIVMNLSIREATEYLNKEDLIGILIDSSGKSH